MKFIALFLIRLYQNTLSVILPPSCRFTPSCSQYGYEAIQRFGWRRGWWSALRRIARCHPFHAGGLDPVPEAYVTWRQARRLHREARATAAAGMRP